jgi:F-type H+-transporting ATPase subunit delta
VHDNRVARRYATAMFETARKYDVVQAVEDDLATFERLLQNDATFRHFFIAPYTSRSEKIATLERIFSDRMTALTMQLIRVMLDKGREREIEAVHSEFAKLRRAAEGVVHATVTSAMALSDQQRSALLAKLEATQGKKFEASFEVDPRLIGGVKVSFESFVLDGTVRGALSKLRAQLRHDVLKQA